MANTYTWTYPTLETAPAEDGLTDVVKTIHWRITAVSDTETNADGVPLSVSAYGTASAGEANADSFVAFDSITQDWCKERVLTSLGKTEAEMWAILDEQMDALVNPPIVNKVPASW
jgi:hypothetical protein